MDKDVTQNIYLSDEHRFADLVNGYVGHGKQLLLPKQLKTLDARSGMHELIAFAEENASYYKGKSEKIKKQKIKYRDIKKQAGFGVNFLVLGVENQETIDYSLPVRIMSYDVGEYERQISTIRKRIRRSNAKKGLRPGEYLYGFRKADRLYPVITFVIYYGEEEWDGSRDLHSMLELSEIPEELRALVSNYKINLIEVRKLEDTSVFETDLKQVFDFIRYSNDKEKLKELVENDPVYQNLAEDAFMVIAQYANAEELLEKKENIKGKDGTVNMCKALKELIADGRAEGEIRGEARGIAMGEARGIAMGEARGIAMGESRLNNLNLHLINENRFDDLKRAANDNGYRKKLFAEFNL